VRKEYDEELTKLGEELKGKSLELEQKASELHCGQLMEARRLAKDAQADCDHEKEAFQMEKENLLCDLEQVRAEVNRKVAELKDQVQEKVFLLKLVKYKQGYIYRAQEKRRGIPLRVMLLKGIELIAYDFRCAAFLCYP